MTPEQLVVSVEHASARVPAALDHLGLGPAWFATHHGWDPGAAAIGRHLARAFAAPLHLGKWSRLVADLNRSSFHPRVIPRTTGGRRIPANGDLSRPARQDRLERYWRPYRAAVGADLDRSAAEYGKAFHLSIHSFTPKLGTEVRRNDFGLLYKPAWRTERAMADRWDSWLTTAGYRVRRNYPYSGLDDGFCMRMRAERPERRYLGMEIEVNQALVRRPAGAQRIARALVEVLEREFAR